ncbi:MAG: O-methyltransferase [Anaerolineales bacterium]
MSQEKWSAVDAYFVEKLVPPDAALDAALAASDAAGLPQHAVAPNQGKLLKLLIQMQKAKRVLELGTLGGYSTIWLAQAVGNGGTVVTLEANPEYASVAKSNIEKAGLSHIVDIRVGAAAETLALLVSEGTEPFDFIFIDADKPNNPEYLNWSLKLARSGTVIVGDNVVRDGAIVDANSTVPSVVGVRKCFDLMADNPRLSATAIQTVGSKGYDGFSIAIVE